MIRRLRAGLPVEMFEGWGEFLVATAGAAAALAGLIIVAMSVHIKTILNIPGMTFRAAAPIASLILSVVSASAGAQNAVMIPRKGKRCVLSISFGHSIGHNPRDEEGAYPSNSTKFLRPTGKVEQCKACATIR
jgi:hypothetical protein